MITNEMWKKLEEEMQGGWVSIDFTYKGYSVEVTRVKVGEGKYQLAVYISGVIQWGWCHNKDERHELVSDVWRPRTKALYTPAKIKEVEKALGKRRAKQYFPKLHDRFVYFDPLFPKASVLCRQFKKLEGLKLVKAECLEVADE